MKKRYLRTYLFKPTGIEITHHYTPSLHVRRCYGNHGYDSVNRLTRCINKAAKKGNVRIYPGFHTTYVCVYENWVGA